SCGKGRVAELQRVASGAKVDRAAEELRVSRSAGGLWVPKRHRDRRHWRSRNLPQYEGDGSEGGFVGESNAEALLEGAVAQHEPLPAEGFDDIVDERVADDEDVAGEALKRIPYRACSLHRQPESAEVLGAYRRSVPEGQAMVATVKTSLQELEVILCRDEP